MNRIVNWISENGGEAYHDGTDIYIRTLEGEMRSSVGDWIIKIVKDEFYSCKGDIFEATYEKVEGSGHTFEQRVKNLKNIVDIQCSHGNWDYDEYMRGMANGLLIALSIFDDKEPVFKESPDKNLTPLERFGKVWRRTDRDVRKKFLSLLEKPIQENMAKGLEIGMILSVLADVPEDSFVATTCDGSCDCNCEKEKKNEQSK